MRCIASFLLLFMALQSAGQLVIFKVQQVQIRKEMKQQIKSGVPDEALVLLKIPQRVEESGNDFQRIHAREFRYRGKMYDIVRQEKYAAVTWYYCLSDEKETALFANLEASVRQDMQGNPHRRAQSDKLLRLISLLYFPLDSDLRYSRLSGQTESIRYFYTVKTWKNSPPSPPPQV